MTAAARYFARLEPLAFDDANQGGVLEALATALMAPREIFEIARADDEHEHPWGNLLDPDACPAELLGWLAVLAGIELPPSALTAAEKRYRIKQAAGRYRCTPRAVVEELQLVLSGTKTVLLGFHVPDEWRYLVGTILTEMPNSDIPMTNLVSNPGAEVDLTDWSGAVSFYLNSATISRDEAERYNGVAAVKVQATSSPGLQGVRYTLTGTFEAGVTYTLAVWVKASAPGSACLFFGAGAPDPGVNQTAAGVNVVDGTWRRFTATWTPSADRVNPMCGVRTPSVGAAMTFWVDGLVVVEGTVAPDEPFAGVRQVTSLVRDAVLAQKPAGMLAEAVTTDDWSSFVLAPTLIAHRETIDGVDTYVIGTPEYPTCQSVLDGFATCQDLLDNDPI